MAIVAVCKVLKNVSAASDAFKALDHPLLERSRELLLRLFKVLPREGKTPSSAGVLMNGAMEISGGLAQALGVGLNDDDDEFSAGLAVVQLKRSLRGAAFALGALFPLKADGVIDKGLFDELYATLKGLEGEIYAELRRRQARETE